MIIQGAPLATEPSIEDIATKFEKEYVRCVRNEEECVCSAPNCCEQQSASQW
jgi:intein-encoded DNA endonuclease-like protein